MLLDLIPVQFQLRYCPALSKKPGASKPESGASQPKSKPDPFENPTGLLVTRLPDQSHGTHNLVLNKYPVIPRHSILSTTKFKKQTDFLEDQDLEVTYSCLQLWEAESTDEVMSRLFAFFNSGEHSGASQNRRHLQFLPVSDMMGPDSQKPEWQPLIDLLMMEPLPDQPSILSNPSLPFCHYAMRIPPSPDAGTLKQIYQYLYDSASNSLQSWNEDCSPKQTALNTYTGQASISYNLAMTTQAMAICPRRSETAVVPTANGEGSVAVNGTILAGTLMVKERSEWDAIRQGQVVIDEVLAEIGIPPSSYSGRPSSTRL